MDEAKIRHLEMIQSVITRMAQNSFALKGWAVTLVAALFALSSIDSKRIFLLAYIPILVFWFLDSYYLQLERKFRVLYVDVATCKTTDVEFRIKPPIANSDNKTLFFQNLLSISEFGFYIPLALLTVVVVAVSKFISTTAV